MFAVAIVAHDCVKGGSVGTVASAHISQLGKRFNVYALTRELDHVQSGSIKHVPVGHRRWDFLRRFCHVPNDLAFQLAARKELTNLCGRVHLDAVWCHSHAAAAIAAETARKVGVPTIITTHGDIFERPKGTYDPVLTAYFKFVTKIAYRDSSAVHALSPRMAESALRGGAKTENIQVIGNGIDPGEIGLSEVVFRKPGSFTGTQELRLLFVGNLLPVKGLRHLLRALVVVAKSSQKVSLRVVGSGPDRSEMEDYCRQNGLGGVVEFAGKVDRGSLRDYYLEADALCVPSDDEPFGLVVLEAFSTGLPVIASGVGGLPFIVSADRGFLFAGGDSKELAEVISSVAANKALLEARSAHCSEAVVQRFGWEPVGAKLASLLEAVIDRRRRAQE